MDADEFITLNYKTLLWMAENLCQREKGLITPESLVHESYLRLPEKLMNETRSHWYARTCRVFRRVIIDRVRAKNAKKRGGDVTTTSMGQEIDSLTTDFQRAGLDRQDTILSLLESLDQTKWEAFALAHYGRLSVAQTALVMNIAEYRVQAELRSVRAWLRDQLEPPSA